MISAQLVEIFKQAETHTPLLNENLDLLFILAWFLLKLWSHLSTYPSFYCIYLPVFSFLLKTKTFLWFKENKPCLKNCSCSMAIASDTPFHS